MAIKFPIYKKVANHFELNYKLAYTYDSLLDQFFSKQKIEEAEICLRKFSPIYFEWKNYSFPVFIHQGEENLFLENGKISFDIYLNVFLFLSGWQEYIFTKKDLHGRFPYEESLQSKFDFVEIPVVNIYFEILFEVALKNKVKIERKKHKNAIILTHDIDQLRSGWFENIQYEKAYFSSKSIWKIPKNILVKLFGLKDSYYKGMERMLQIDKENNVDAISFFLVEKSHKNADFDIEKTPFQKIIKQTLKQQKIGLHPTYEAFDNEEIYIQEIEKLTKLTNVKISKSRQHFLRYDILKTPFIQEKLSIKEDYTLGFAEHYGFRNSIVNPFYLFNFKDDKSFDILQFPLVFMDVSLMNYRLEKDFGKVMGFLKTITQDFNCHFSVLFHNSVFSDGKYKGFEEFYLKLINISKKNH